MKNWNSLKTSYLVLALIITKGICLPGWTTCVELIAVLSFVGFRWTIEPKPAKPVSAGELADLNEKLDVVASEVKKVKLTFGMDSGRKFSAFTQGK